MTQVKIFDGYSETLESRINEWLAEHTNIEITHIKATDSSSQQHLNAKTIYIFYKEKGQFSLNS